MKLQWNGDKWLKKNSKYGIKNISLHTCGPWKRHYETCVHLCWFRPISWISLVSIVIIPFKCTFPSMSEYQGFHIPHWIGTRYWIELDSETLCEITVHNTVHCAKIHRENTHRCIQVTWWSLFWNIWLCNLHLVAGKRTIFAALFRRAFNIINCWSTLSYLMFNMSCSLKGIPHPKSSPPCFSNRFRCTLSIISQATYSVKSRICDSFKNHFFWKKVIFRMKQWNEDAFTNSRLHHSYPFTGIWCQIPEIYMSGEIASYAKYKALYFSFLWPWFAYEAFFLCFLLYFTL